MKRVVHFVVHNWPLKLAAIGLASLLYGGVVLSQSNRDIPVSVTIRPTNGGADVIVLSDLGQVTRVSYVAPPDIGLHIDSQTFTASVDLADVEPTGGPVSLDVSVQAVDPRIQVLDFQPRRILVTLDRVGTKTVPVRAISDQSPRASTPGPRRSMPRPRSSAARSPSSPRSPRSRRASRSTPPASTSTSWSRSCPSTSMASR
jgi:hypothetical protein